MFFKGFSYFCIQLHQLSIHFMKKDTIKKVTSQESSSITTKPILEIRSTTAKQKEDQIIVEEPLEIKIRISTGEKIASYDLSVTMRTPGDDFNLVKGFLFTEGIISADQDIIKINYTDTLSGSQGNSITAHLSPHTGFSPDSLQRHFYTSSSCGVCGKTSIEMVKQQSPYLMKVGQPRIEHTVLSHVLHEFSAHQDLFNLTGGNHAAAVFDSKGTITHAAEDVGRHNAFDKLIGHLLSKQKIPFHAGGVIVSGRASFELMQKCWMSGIPLFAAIGAPSSLAVELAEDTGITLVGFLSEDRMNIYSYADRIFISDDT